MDVLKSNSRYEFDTSGEMAAAANQGVRDTWGTSTQLLRQLKNTPGHPRWAAFYRRYAPLILSFARQRGCEYDQAEDVLQETMVRLMRVLPGFDYDPKKGSFRSYLLKIVQNLVYSQNGKKAKKRKLEEDLRCSGGVLDAASASGWDLAWKQNVMARALEIVKTRVTRITYESFRLYALEDRPADEVASRLGISKNTVYQHRNRMIRLLGEEVKQICQSDEQDFDKV